ncbi:hypothetical protein PAHAL_6G303000 [Panicum hallii]|uniref:Uncharacterized protein n=1 Tax=Panicum hallii TaxID=206008 RepID=A0A2T8IIA1_9POAL|nr:hypothetical protein PAHAL_6G303000 [Panicum hallii]PVH37403.1 hypothetical protein PAHAL_6G303000 [Panicum hallii]
MDSPAPAILPPRKNSTWAHLQRLRRSSATLRHAGRRIRIHNHVPAAHHTTVAPNNSRIHGYATRYFNTLLRTRASSGTGIPASSVPSVHTLKPEFVNSAGVKPTFSSSTSDVADWFAKKKAEDAAFLGYIRRHVGSWCLIFCCYFSMLDSGSSHSDTSNCEGKSGSYCQAAASANPAVKNP